MTVAGLGHHLRHLLAAFVLLGAAAGAVGICLLTGIAALATAWSFVLGRKRAGG